MKEDSFLKTKNIIIQTRLWAFAAWTLPFVALAIMVLSEFLGFNSLTNIFTAIIATFFVAVSVFWWWWAISKISQFAKMMQETDEKLKSIKIDIGTLKEDL